MVKKSTYFKDITSEYTTRSFRSAATLDYIKENPTLTYLLKTEHDNPTWTKVSMQEHENVLNLTIQRPFYYPNHKSSI